MVKGPDVRESGFLVLFYFKSKVMFSNKSITKQAQQKLKSFLYRRDESLYKRSHLLNSILVAQTDKMKLLLRLGISSFWNWCLHTLPYVWDIYIYLGHILLIYNSSYHIIQPCSINSNLHLSNQLQPNLNSILIGLLTSSDFSLFC